MISSLWPSCALQRFYCPRRRFKSASHEMALEIRRDFPDDLHVIAVLKGAFIFLSDLARRDARPCLARLHGRLQLRQGHDLVRRGEDGQGPGNAARRPQRRHRRGHRRHRPDAELPAEDSARAPPQVAADRMSAEQTLAPQGRCRGGIHRLHDRRPLRRRLRPRLRRAVSQPAAHRRAWNPRSDEFRIRNPQSAIPQCLPTRPPPAPSPRAGSRRRSPARGPAS